MSKRCRQDRTAIAGESVKLLILKGRATVSEGRQGGQLVAGLNINTKRREANVIPY